MTVTVHTPVFDGPFDLLLHLILRDQVELYEVSLNDIVAAYLAELERMESLNLEVATEFLLIAATLVEMKARRLLPGDDSVDLDDELALWEERDLLLARLLECKTFKDAAGVLETMHRSQSRCTPRICGPDERFDAVAPDLLDGVTPDRLAAAFLTATAPRPVATVDLFHVAPIRASVVDAVSLIVSEVRLHGRSTFRALTAGIVDRIELAVRFLAVLELFKQGIIGAHQGDAFGDIELTWIEGQQDETDLASIDHYDG